MLRLLVAALLLVNLLFFAWSRGWLDQVVGIPAQGDREPHRLASQVRPELVRLLPPTGQPGSASEAASAVLAAGAAASAASSAATAVAPASAAAPALLAAASPVGTGAPPKAPAASVASRPSPPPVAASAPGVAATAVVAAASQAAAACFEAGPYAPGEWAAAEAAARSTLPSGSWSARKAEGSGEWMIYMGPYPDRDWLDRKKSELARIRGGVPQEEVNAPPELARGLSLGRFASQGAANATLASYRSRGIRTARVVRSGNGPAVSFLRVAQADAALATQIAGLKPGGKAFLPCGKAP